MFNVRAWLPIEVQLPDFYKHYIDLVSMSPKSIPLQSRMIPDPPQLHDISLNISTAEMTYDSAVYLRSTLSRLKCPKAEGTILPMR